MITRETFKSNLILYSDFGYIIIIFTLFGDNNINH